MKNSRKDTVAWDEQLDAMIAAPDNHGLLLENETVRVLDSLLRPGESTPLHTHQWSSVQYVLGFGDFVRKDSDGIVLLDTRLHDSKPSSGTAFWSEPLEPHSVTNVGADDIHVISVELKIPT